MKTLGLLAAVAVVIPATASFAQEQTGTPAAEAMPQLMQQLDQYQTAEATIQKNLETFDTLDFDVYTNQKWDRLGESHAEDILVHYPDGSTTTGLEDHIAAISQTFVFAPDTHIDVHPIRFGSGPWTGVIGVLEGTFTEPMPTGDGETIPPTGKPFSLTMATIGHWTDAGVMDEEYLFYDNAEFMREIGLGQ